MCALTSCASLRGAPSPEYAAITLPFNPAAYDSIAVAFVNSSNQWLPADAVEAAQVRVTQRLDERGYSARMRSIAGRSDATRMRRSPHYTAAPTTEWVPMGTAGWAPGGALTSDAARDVALEVGVPAVLIFDVLDVRMEVLSGAADSLLCRPLVWRGASPPASTGRSQQCRPYDWAVPRAWPGEPVGTRRTGVSVYARLIDRETGTVVWARRVGGWGLSLDNAVSTLVESLPSHAKPNP
jgi:hypothetical protein